MPNPPMLASRPWLRVTALTLALGLGGCMVRGGDVTGSVGDPGRSTLDALGRRYDADRRDKGTALAYAAALRASDQSPQSLAVLESLATVHLKDQQVLAAYGKALVDAGRYDQAVQVLDRAHTPDRPDPKVLASQGIAYDGLGDHARAQALYAAAIKIRPEDSGVWNNLGMSYALSKRLPQAEDVLRRGAALPGAPVRLRQNLALVLGLQGRFQDAEAELRRNLPPADAEANLAALRGMVAGRGAWSDIQAAPKRAEAKRRAPPRAATAPAAPAEPDPFEATPKRG